MKLELTGDTVTIDGVVYEKREVEKPNRPRVDSWATIRPDCSYTYWCDESSARKYAEKYGDECVKLIEEIPGTAQVTRKTLADAYGEAFGHSPDDNVEDRPCFKLMAKALGFPEET